MQKAIGYQVLTVSTVPLSLSLPLRAASATIYIENASVFIVADGSVPSATNGILGRTGDILEITQVSELAGFRVIRATTQDAKLYVEYQGPA